MDVMIINYGMMTTVVDDHNDLIEKYFMNNVKNDRCIF